MAILKVKGLSKRYTLGEQEINALQRVDFTVLKGEFVALMGPSGSGKSTLLHLLGAPEKPLTAKSPWGEWRFRF